MWLYHRTLRLASRLLRDREPGHGVVRLLVAPSIRLAGTAPANNRAGAALHPEQRVQLDCRGKGEV